MKKPIQSQGLQNLQDDLRNATTKEEVIAIAKKIGEMGKKQV